VFVAAAVDHRDVTAGQAERLGDVGGLQDPRLVPAEHAVDRLLGVQLLRRHDQRLGVQRGLQHGPGLDVVLLPCRLGVQEHVDPVLRRDRAQDVLAEQAHPGRHHEQVRTFVGRVHLRPPGSERGSARCR
jgi:hypothetical protein